MKRIYLTSEQVAPRKVERYYVEILDYNDNQAYFYITAHSTDEIRDLIDCKKFISIETIE